MRPFFLLFPLLLCVLAASCKKADNEPIAEDHLRTGPWKQYSGTSTYRIPGTDRDTTINVFVDYPNCAKDNKIVFDKTFTGRLLFLGDACVPGEPAEKEFQWDVTDAGTRLHIYNAQEMFGTEAVNGALLTIEPARFTIRYQIYSNPTPGDRDTVTMTSVFVH